MPDKDSKPWWVDLTKEIGGLGIVLVMLVGLYVLGDRYLADMKETWDSIEKVNEAELKEAVAHRETVQKGVSDFMTAQDLRMTELSKRIAEALKRVDELERRGQ